MTATSTNKTPRLADLGGLTLTLASQTLILTLTLTLTLALALALASQISAAKH